MSVLRGNLHAAAAAVANTETTICSPQVQLLNEKMTTNFSCPANSTNFVDDEDFSFADFMNDGEDGAEITIQFEDEIQTLYVGPVEIKDHHLFHENNPPDIVPHGPTSPQPIQVVLVQQTVNVNNCNETITQNGYNAPTQAQVTAANVAAAAAATINPTLPDDSSLVADPIIDPKNGGGAVEEQEKSATEQESRKKEKSSPRKVAKKSPKKVEKPKNDKVNERNIRQTRRQAKNQKETEDKYENSSPASDSGIENGPDELLEPSIRTTTSTTTKVPEPRKNPTVEPTEKEPIEVPEVTEIRVTRSKVSTKTQNLIKSEKKSLRNTRKTQVKQEVEPPIDLENIEIQPQNQEVPKTTEGYEILQEIEILPSGKVISNGGVIEVLDVDEIVKSAPIKCVKCTMSFKTEVWYKKHLINYHGVDLTNIAHFLTNLQPENDGVGTTDENEDQLLNDLLESEAPSDVNLQNFTENEEAFNEEPPAVEPPEPAPAAPKPQEPTTKKRRTRDVSSKEKEKKKRVERISFEMSDPQSITVDEPLLKNPFVVQYLAKEIKPQPEQLDLLMKHVGRANKENQKDGEKEIEFHESQILSVTVDGVQKFGCSLCGATFTKRFSVQPHILRVHARKRDKVCKWCNRGFSQTGDLTRHERTHTGEKPFKCGYPNCGFSFISSGDLFKHSKRHQDGGPPKTHVCDVCKTAFETKYDLTRHRLRHEMDQDPSVAGFRCEICHKRFARKDQYRNHTYRHLGFKPFKCECGKSFSDASNFNKHKKTHLGVADTASLKCDRCGKSFKNKMAISKHVYACARKKNSSKK